MPNPLFWDIKRTLSYNCLFNFIIGMRGAGKTYGALKYAVEQHLKYRNTKTPWEWLYVRRIGRELENLTTTNKGEGGRLFKAVKKEFPEHQLKASGDILYCDGEVMGYATALSTASILKSDATFDNVKFLIFDEFIIDNRGTYHYLKDEVTKFLDLYETVARPPLRNVVCMFLSNAVTVSNPYFDFFMLDKPRDCDIQRFGKAKEILVENVVRKNLSAMKKESRFGQIISGTDYSDYAYDNEWLLDNEDFLGKKTQRCHYYITLLYKDKRIGIWVDMKDWLYYVSDDVEMQGSQVYAVTMDDQKPNLMLMEHAKSQPALKKLMDAYRLGAMRYESMKLKNDFRDIMRMMG